VRIVLTTILVHETDINEEVKDQIIPKPIMKPHLPYP